ncbi:hypothetical protein Vafri_21126 [Volvox africanus]|uniref:Uncharacterized protein n=1 Tax=Volvox africanus TaxID=51714 RepID=A0A8J4BTQ2_9CHLO|nr:hypothetical protein Vafri_21126 [Volvox africanus]
MRARTRPHIHLPMRLYEPSSRPIVGTLTHAHERAYFERIHVLRSIAWSTCALSSHPLRSPIATCDIGRLYNKDEVLQFLLVKKGKVTSPEALLAYANQLLDTIGHE